jgi:tetratricopeptide (TPR) repeat protein/TolB-like protein
MVQHHSTLRPLIFFVFIIFCGNVCDASPQTAVRSQFGVANAATPAVYLVFPFENEGSSPRLEWLGEGLEELTIQRLSAAGEQVYSHSGRINELERYGLPPSAKFSRATMIRVAQDLDADFVIFGSYSSDGTSLTVNCRVLKVNPTKLQQPLRESGPLDTLMDLNTKLAWRILSANDHAYPMKLTDFAKLQRPLRLDAFEHYARGLMSGEDDARLRELREAARLEPEWPDPDFALGETYFARRDCNSALPWFARVPKTHDSYVEAVFATGVCKLLLNQPDEAEEIFAGLQDAMHKDLVSGADLPEILNNLAIARGRQGKMAEAQSDLRRAAEIDPDGDDYPFNLGLLALRANDAASAAGYFRDASEREADNPEDRALLIVALEKAGKKAEADQERDTATEAFGPNGIPAIKLDAKGEAIAKLDRIKPELDTTALRLDLKPGEPNAGVVASVGQGTDTPAAHSRRGRQELSAGQIDAATKDFQAAIAGDAGNVAAHRGLAEIYRRQGKLDDAIKELQSSLQTQDSAVVRVSLARIFLEQKKPVLARTEVERALKLAPNYAEAKQLLEHLQNGKPAEKKPVRGAQ